MKFIFIPFSVTAGLMAGLLAKRVFKGLWGATAHVEPPDPKHREVDYAKLVTALALEGAVARLTRGMLDHGARRGFARVTGTWPGEQAPDPT